MASSQVEIASSSSSNPFGCVLRDRNNGEAVVTLMKKKNLKELVRDHLQTCYISVSPNNDNHNNNNNNNNDENAQYKVKQYGNKNLRCAINHRNNGGGGGGNDGDLSKQDKLLERWAAKQAKRMVSSLGKQQHQQEEEEEEEEDHHRLDSNKSSNVDQSTDSENLAASSLVQIWEARLINHPSKAAAAASFNRSHSLNNHNHNHNIPDINDKPSSARAAPSASFNILANNLNARDDSSCCSSFSSFSSVDWDSASVANSRRSSDAAESEKLRVSDIIKRLTCDTGEQFSGNGGDSLSLCRVVERRLPLVSSSDQTEHQQGQRWSLPQLVSSPRLIRGRQAFHDLLLQLEKERQKEIDSLTQHHAVSKFPQKGRIQTMLRLRSMQRCIAIQEQQRARPQSTRLTTPLDTNRPHQGSNIAHIRERFNTGVEQQTISAPSDLITPRSSTKTGNSCKQSGLPSTSNQLSEGSNGHHEISTIKEGSAPHTVEQLSAPKKLEERAPSQNSEPSKEEQEETNMVPDVTWQGTSSDIENLNSQETSQTSSFLNGWDENGMEEEEEEEEEAAELQDFEEAIDDWFSSIARPRSYWEDKRQAWYQEILSRTPDNNEIRQLLERRTVSTFLSSDFRERMNQLMVSRTQILSIQQDEEIDVDRQERMGQLMLSYLQRHSHSSNAQEELQEQEAGRGGDEEQILHPQQHQHREEEESEEEKLEEDEHREESPSSCQFIEATDYFDQSQSSPIHSPSPLRSWNRRDNNEVSDSSERISAPLPFRPRLPESSLQDGQINHPSIEMELIYNLRGHMQQLQHEMSELRRSIQRCTEMQVQLLRVHPVRRDEKKPVDKSLGERICCICYETHVDSFLYRCGHMCTCLKCAHELQWGSGKCPICRAPILDVVRAYLDT